MGTDDPHAGRAVCYICAAFPAFRHLPFSILPISETRDFLFPPGLTAEQSTRHRALPLPPAPPPPPSLPPGAGRARSAVHVRQQHVGSAPRHRPGRQEGHGRRECGAGAARGCFAGRGRAGSGGRGRAGGWQSTARHGTAQHSTAREGLPRSFLARAGLGTGRSAVPAGSGR